MSKWIEEILEKQLKTEGGEDDLKGVIDLINKGIGTRFVSKDDFNKKNDLTKALKDDLSGKEIMINDQNKKLEDLKLKAGNNEELNKQLDIMKETNTKELEVLKDNFRKREFELLLDSKLKDANVRNSKAVLALLDKDIIKVDGGKILGLDEQVNNLRESDGYLFKTDDHKDNIPAGNSPNPGGGQGGNLPIDTSKMSDKEYYIYMSGKK